jgi:hypothetical protein
MAASGGCRRRSLATVGVDDGRGQGRPLGALAVTGGGWWQQGRATAATTGGGDDYGGPV